MSLLPPLSGFTEKCKCKVLEESSRVFYIFWFSTWSYILLEIEKNLGSRSSGVLWDRKLLWESTLSLFCALEGYIVFYAIENSLVFHAIVLFWKKFFWSSRDLRLSETYEKWHKILSSLPRDAAFNKRDIENDLVWSSMHQIEGHLWDKIASAKKPSSSR